MLQRPQRRRTRRQAVDHDVAAGRDMGGAGACPVVGVWVGDVERKMVGAVRLVKVDGVAAFGRASITLLALGTGDPAESN